MWEVHKQTFLELDPPYGLKIRKRLPMVIPFFWHRVFNHSLPLYACWTSDGGGMGDAPERGQTHRPHSVPVSVATIEKYRFNQ